MAMVDRGGGREGKGHDRRTKRSHTQKENPFLMKKGPVIPELVHSPPAPALSGVGTLIDAGCNLVSRQLSRDQARIFARATDAAVDGIVSFSTDFDRVAELTEIVRTYPHQLYAAIGLHPDNVKRGNDKLLAARLGELRSFALTPECVALYCGLDLTRDISSHYQQEKLLEGQWTIAADTHLPVVIVDIGATERLAEKLADFWTEFSSSCARAIPEEAALDGAAEIGATVPGAGEPSQAAGVVMPVPDVSWVPRFAIFAFEGDERALDLYLRVGVSIIITGLVCDPTEQGERLRTLLRRIPLERLMVASNAPMHTPATIADHHIRTTRNEPSNLPAVLPVLVEAYNSAQPSDAPPWGNEHWCAFAARSVIRFVEPPVLAAVSSDALYATAPPIPPGFIDVVVLSRILYHNTAQFYQIPCPAGSLLDSRSDGSSLTTAVPPPDAGLAPTPAAPASVGEEGTRSTPTAEHPRGLEPAVDASVTPTATALESPVVQYKCRVCRTTLFSSDDVKPHDSMQLRPSLASQAAAAAVASQSRIAGEKKGSTKRGERATIKPPEAPSDEVAYSRWHEAKGKAVKHKDVGGPCRQLQVDQMPWMIPAAGSASGSPDRDLAGSLLCPGCGSKIGQYNLGGMKCSCGLFVCPGFKIPRDRVDEDVLSGAGVGVDALQVALAAAELEGQHAAASDGDDASDGSDAPGSGPKKKKKAKLVRNKVISFRNKDFSGQGKRAEREMLPQILAKALAPIEDAASETILRDAAIEEPSER